MFEEGLFSELRVRAPAKINLGLRILGRRPDGYHEIETLFVAVSLFDELRLQRRDSGGLNFVCAKGDADFDPETLGRSEDNLVVRAVRLVEDECRETLNLSIHLVKNIPIAAGLGGGSSDAAATLWALSKLYPELVAREKLASWAARLGSDVPFFLGPPTAIGRGRGELLEPITLPCDFWVIILCPKQTLSTPEVYRLYDLTSPRLSPRLSWADAYKRNDFYTTLAVMYNDLEDVVLNQVPALRKWQQRLVNLGAEGAFVSGSGPAIFGVFRNRPDAGCVGLLRNEMPMAYFARPLEAPSALLVAER